MTTLTIPNNITTDTVHRVRPIIDDLRTFIRTQRRHDRVHPELEIRLCREDSGGISEKAWMRLLSALDACTTWSGKKETSELVDFFYDAKIQEETVPIRTTRYISPEGDVRVEHLSKSPVRQTFVRLKGCSSVAQRAKIVFSTEESLDPSTLPDLTTTTNVRIKHRRSFMWKSWRFDMTKSWRGSTYSAATQNRDNNFNTMCECEIELVDPTRYVDSHNNDYISLSLLLKLVGLLPPQCEVA
tara:strand:+ start:251 stop:976 length:726 start_codon:yes stop_codon:yes gene_type:complete